MDALILWNRIFYLFGSYIQEYLIFALIILDLSFCIFCSHGLGKDNLRDYFHRFLSLGVFGQDLPFC